MHEGIAMDSGVLGGLMVMVCWGVSDFIQSLLIRQMGTAKTMVTRNLFTLLVALCLGGYLVFSRQLHFDAVAVLIIVCSSAAYVLGYYAYMRGCEVGSLTLVSPVASAYSLVTIVFSTMFLHERLPFAAWVAVLGIFLGIVMLSGNVLGTLRGGSQGLSHALLAMAGFGAAFFILGLSAKKLNVMNAFFYSAFSQAVLFIALGLCRKGALQRRDIRASRFMVFLAHSLLVNAGWVFYIFASSVGDLSLVTPISSVYSGVTVVLAMLFFKEKTAIGQKAGIVVLLLGVFFLSYFHR